MNATAALEASLMEERKALNARYASAEWESDVEAIDQLLEENSDKLDALKAPTDYKALCDAIHAVLDRNEWNSDSTEQIADLLRDAGYVLRDVQEEPCDTIPTA